MFSDFKKKKEKRKGLEESLFRKAFSSHVTLTFFQNVFSAMPNTVKQCSLLSLCV